MKRIFSSLLIVLMVGLGAFAKTPSTSDIEESHQLPYGASGGVYYAYPTSSVEKVSVPAGFSPVLVSHYGRHGSRQAIKDFRYLEVINELERQHIAGNLTDLGKEVEEKVHKLWSDAKDKLGSLTKLGEQQHKGIATRMIGCYPELFQGSAVVETYASTEPRCIVSMAAFCERLKEVNPSLSIDRHVTPGGMDFISYSTPEAKALNSDMASWQQSYRRWTDSVLNSDHLMKSLFKKPAKVKFSSRFVQFLHDLAVTEQNLDTEGTGLLKIFTEDELYSLWRILNYNMYVKHAYSGFSSGAGPHSAASLLDHIISTADSVLTTGNPGVILRFGHDSALIRLLALMQVKGCANEESDPDKFNLAWQDYKVSPMAANLQIIFYRNEAGKVIVHLLHNERTASLPISDYSPGFYLWNEVKKLWQQQMQ